MINLVVSIILIFLLSFYGLNLKQSFPKYVYKIYEEPLYKFLLILCIGLIANNNFCIGLILALLFVGIGLNIQNVSETFSNYMRLNEKFTNHLPLHSCDTYNYVDDNEKRSLFYPMNPRIKNLKPHNPYQ